MTGRTAYEAYKSYISTTEAILRCLPYAKMSKYRENQLRAGYPIEWNLSDMRDHSHQGLVLKNIGVIQMRENARIVDISESVSHRGSKYQAIREGYLYDLEFHSGETISWHFHPSGNSDFLDPHMHISPERKIHIPSTKAYLSDVVRVCIEYLIRNRNKIPYRDWQEKLIHLRKQEYVFNQTQFFR